MVRFFRTPASARPCRGLVYRRQCVAPELLSHCNPPPQSFRSKAPPRDRLRPSPASRPPAAETPSTRPVGDFPDRSLRSRRRRNSARPGRNSTIARNPPDRPCPSRAMRCLITPPPRSASIKPLTARRTASHSASSSIPSRSANRAKGLLLYANQPARPAPGSTSLYNTKCYRMQFRDTTRTGRHRMRNRQETSARTDRALGQSFGGRPVTPRTSARTVPRSHRCSPAPERSSASAAAQERLGAAPAPVEDP